MLHEAEVLSKKQESIPGENESLESGEPVVEAPEDLDRLVAEKIALAVQEVEALSGEGETRMGKANDSIGLPPEKVDEISVSLDVKSNLGKISEKAKQLLTEMRSKMKSAAAIGMAALALGGAGDFERVEASVLPKSEVSATETTKDGQTASAAKIEDGEQNETVRPEKKKELKREIIVETEKIRQDLIEHVSSQDYLDRLMIEVRRGLNSDKNSPTYNQDKISEFAHAILSMRIKRLKNVKINVLPPGEMRAAFEKIRISNGNNDENDEPIAFYSGKGEIYLPLEKPRKDIIFHELSHAITADEDYLLSESYIKGNDENDAYFGKTSERRALKQALDWELENLGIKKYGETFTKEHFKKMMEGYEQGKFSSAANVFIRTTKPEFFEKIFNEIAANEVNKQEQLA